MGQQERHGVADREAQQVLVLVGLSSSENASTFCGMQNFVSLGQEAQAFGTSRY